MHILIYSYNYHPEPIGIAPLMTELAEGLVNRGHEVRVITGMPNYPEREIYDGYRGQWYVNEQKMVSQFSEATSELSLNLTF